MNYQNGLIIIIDHCYWRQYAHKATTFYFTNQNQNGPTLELIRKYNYNPNRDVSSQTDNQAKVINYVT